MAMVQVNRIFLPGKSSVFGRLPSKFPNSRKTPIASKALRARKALAIDKTEHGQYIYIYIMTRTNRVVYSLTREMNERAALKQIPFLGKKTVPATIRKDFWSPLATACFPSGHQGLQAYRQLREYSRRHLQEWTYKSIAKLRKIRDLPKLSKSWEGERPYEPFNVRKAERRFLAKQLGPALQDQKANSIADLAAVLQLQAKYARTAQKEKRALLDKDRLAVSKAKKRLEELLALRKELRNKPDGESVKKYKEVKNEKMRIQRALDKPLPSAALAGKYNVLNDPLRPFARRGRLRKLQRKSLLPIFNIQDVKIEWANPLDRQFAKAWPEEVTHAKLSRPYGYIPKHLPQTKTRPPTSKSLRELVNHRHATRPLREAQNKAREKRRQRLEVKMQAWKARQAERLPLEGKAAKDEPTEVTPAEVESKPPSTLARIIARLRDGSR